MPNILEEYNATSEQRIDDKTEIYSVTTKDVGLTVREGVELALLYPQADIVKTYPKDFITRDVAYNLFISLQNNVSGDTANGANWQPLSSNASQSVYDLGVISDDFANGYEATVPPIASYSTSNIYLFKPDNTNTGASTLQINALAVLPIKKYISGAIANVAAGDLNLANTYLLIYKTTYFLIASVSSGGGGVSTFSALTDSPYDNTLLAEALDSKQDKSNGVLTGCTITLGSYGGGGSNNDIRVTEGTWRISPGEYGNVGSGNTDFLDITLSASGLQRYVELVGTTSNTIIKVEGAESAIAVRPTLLGTQVSLGSILVKDALIDPPVPDLSGYIPLTGSSVITGDLLSTNTVYRIGKSLDKKLEFHPNGVFLTDDRVSTSSTIGVSNNGTNTFAQMASNVPGNGSTLRTFDVISNAPYRIYQDILQIIGLTHVEIAAKLNAEPYGLITKQYFDDNAPSGVTNLGYTPSPTNGIVTSDTGTDATLTLVDGTNAGLVSPSMKNTWDNKQSTLTDVNFATFVNSTTNKTTPVDADIVPIVDVSTGKRFSLSNLWTNWLVNKIQTTALTISVAWERKGVANNSSAASGYIGEVLMASGYHAGIVTATITNVGSLSLPAGDYDVESSVEIIFNSGTAGGTVATSISENATLNILGTVIIRYPFVAWSANGARLQSGRIIVKKASTGSVYCCAYQEFGGGTCDVRWYITARRVR